MPYLHNATVNHTVLHVACLQIACKVVMFHMQRTQSGGVFSEEA